LESKCLLSQPRKQTLFLKTTAPVAEAHAASLTFRVGVKRVSVTAVTIGARKSEPGQEEEDKTNEPL
jgi:hypothetical protein